MSLLLRKACQTVLDDVGLSAYHVDVNSSKSLSIVAECGKPLVAIHGIRFNRITPNEAEITFASELLDDFMGTHHNLLTDYLKKEAELKKFKLPESDLYSAHVGSTHIRHKGYVKVGTVSYSEGFFDHVVTYHFDEDDSDVGKYKLKSSIDEDKLPNDFKIGDLTKAKCDVKIFNDAKKYLSHWVKEDNMENELSDLLTAVNACDI